MRGDDVLADGPVRIAFAHDQQLCHSHACIGKRRPVCAAWTMRIEPEAADEARRLRAGHHRIANERVPARIDLREARVPGGGQLERAVPAEQRDGRIAGFVEEPRCGAVVPRGDQVEEVERA